MPRTKKTVKKSVKKLQNTFIKNMIEAFNPDYDSQAAESMKHCAAASVAYNALQDQGADIPTVDQIRVLAVKKFGDRTLDAPLPTACYLDTGEPTNTGASDNGDSGDGDASVYAALAAMGLGSDAIGADDDSDDYGTWDDPFSAGDDNTVDADNPRALAG